MTSTLHPCQPFADAPERWQTNLRDNPRYPGAAHHGVRAHTLRGLRQRAWAMSTRPFGAPHALVVRACGRAQACDNWGCACQSKDLPQYSYGAGARYTIDTTRPFRVSLRFPTTPSGDLADLVVTLQQGDSVLHVPRGWCDYDALRMMSRPLREGMVLVASHWGNANWASWLSAPPCPADEECFAHATVPISDIVVNGAPLPPSPPPQPPFAPEPLPPPPPSPTPVPPPPSPTPHAPPPGPGEPAAHPMSVEQISTALDDAPQSTIHVEDTRDAPVSGPTDGAHNGRLARTARGKLIALFMGVLLIATGSALLFHGCCTHWRRIGARHVKEEGQKLNPAHDTARRSTTGGRGAPRGVTKPKQLSAVDPDDYEEEL